MGSHGCLSGKSHGDGAVSSVPIQISGQCPVCPGSVSLTESCPHLTPPLSITLSALLCSPAFTFPHPINPVAYQQILSQQRGLGSAFGHTPPLIQPSPTFLAQQPMAFTSINATSTQLSSSSNCLSDGNQVGGGGGRGATRHSSAPSKGQSWPSHARNMWKDSGHGSGWHHTSGQRPRDQTGLRLDPQSGGQGWVLTLPSLTMGQHPASVLWLTVQ